MAIPLPDEHEAHVVEAPPYAVAPAGDTLGVWHLQVALDDLPFPMTAAELRARVGNWRMPITGAHFHTIDEFLRGIDDDERFRSPAGVARAVVKAHPELAP